MNPIERLMGKAVLAGCFSIHIELSVQADRVMKSHTEQKLLSVLFWAYIKDKNLFLIDGWLLCESTLISVSLRYVQMETYRIVW